MEALSIVPMPCDLTISIVNHSNPELLQECLRSLFRATHRLSLDVWVVDNATDGRGVEPMQQEFPSVHWIFNKQRQGFSTNHNQVLRRAQGRFACILNDDILVYDRAFDVLVEFMDRKAEVGMVGPRLVNADGSQQNCTFRFMTLLSELIGACWLPAACDGWKRIGLDPAQDQNETQPVDWVLGACIVVRRAVLDEVGLLDDELSPIANSEEVDWCYRARQKGWEVAYCPAATLLHYGGQSMKHERQPDGPDRMYVEMIRTRIAFFRKHYGRAKAFLLRAIYVAAFPWNLGMLTQSLLRRRLSLPEFRRQAATTASVAAHSLSQW